MQYRSFGRSSALFVVILLLLIGINFVTTTTTQPSVSPLGVLDTEQPIPYFISTGQPSSGYRSGDNILAEWALAAWETAAGGALRFRSSSEDSSLIRLYWTPASGGNYGEMQSILVNGKRGAMVFVRPETDLFGTEIAKLARTDPLFRDTIVYLTCLHELGHSLGLSHTNDYDDIMYFFGYGGNVPNYFSRYRQILTGRPDIQKKPGLSASDIQRLLALYP